MGAPQVTEVTLERCWLMMPLSVLSFQTGFMGVFLCAEVSQA